MTRVNRGLVFWVLLLVSAIALPATAVTKKFMWQAKIATASGAGVGSAVITQVSGGQPGYLAGTFNAPNRTVVKVSLVRDDGTWPGAVVLCENGGDAGDCTYDDTRQYNLDIDGTIVPAMLIAAGINGAAYNDALRNGHLVIQLNDGALGQGTFVQVYP